MSKYIKATCPNGSEFLLFETSSRWNISAEKGYHFDSKAVLDIILNQYEKEGRPVPAGTDTLLINDRHSFVISYDNKSILYTGYDGLYRGLRTTQRV